MCFIVEFPEEYGSGLEKKEVDNRPVYQLRRSEGQQLAPELERALFTAFGNVA